MISYAQNFEDVLLARVFRDKCTGFYVDVGASDPDHFSVTRHFYERGWSGINIEPVPESYERLLDRRPRDINLASAAGRTNATRDIFVPEDHMFATFDLTLAAAADPRSERITVAVRTLDSILEASNVSHVDFMTIDVEGSEADVLDGLDLRRFRPVVLVIEATKPGASWDYEAPSRILTHDRWEPRVLEHGYGFVYFDGLNRFYVREEERELDRFFSCPVGPVRDTFRLSADMTLESNLREELEQAGHAVETLRRELQQLRDEH